MPENRALIVMKRNLEIFKFEKWDCLKVILMIFVSMKFIECI